VQLAGAVLGALVVMVFFIGLSGPEEANQIKPAAAGKVEEKAGLISKMKTIIPVRVRKVEPGVPDEIEGEVKTMLHSDRLWERREAAKKVLAHKPQSSVAAYLRNIAALETARGCKKMKKAIQTLKEAKDDRTLNALKRVSRRRKTGCGFLNLEDCYGCVRGDLRRAIRAIRDGD
jgi:hypothetical protein